MGNEALCRVEYDGGSDEAKALLETDEVIVRAPFRLKIPFRDMQFVRAEDGWLRFTWQRRAVALHLGAEAAKWAAKITNPKSRADKLGIKRGQNVETVGKLDRDFLDELAGRGVVFSKRSNDIIFFAANDRSDLERLPVLKNRLVASGAIWVVRPKGTKAIADADVMAAGKRAGLVDVKVVRFSETHTAEKLVIPVTKRSPSP